MENREYIAALKEHHVCGARFVSAARHLNGPEAGSVHETLAPAGMKDCAANVLPQLEALPWGPPSSQPCLLALIVLDAFDLAGADYPVELIRRCVAPMYPGARISLVLRFIADTDACWVPEQVLRLFDHFWVPSAHSAAALPPDLAPRIALIPEVCRAPACLPPQPPRRAEPFVFLAVMNDYGLDDRLHPEQPGPLRWNAARKNLAGLLEAFCSEFLLKAGGAHGEVELLVKSTRPGLQEDVDRFLAGLCADRSSSVGSGSRVRVVDAWLPDIGAFLRRGHCLVAPSRGEGWCRPLAEALLAGVPAVGSSFGGQREFLSSATGYLVSAALVECPFTLGRSWDGRGRWGEVDLGELQRILRHVVTHYDEALSRARVGQQLVAQRCSPRSVAEAIRDTLIRPTAGRLLADCVGLPVETFEIVD